MDLADELGPIYSLVAPGQDMIVVSGGDIASECLDETRFEKNVAPELVAMREVVGDAIFTSWTQEPAWKKAHNILLPAFAPQAIKGYTEKMADIADQLVMKWARLNPGDPVDIVTDMTKLTFDTICLVCFSYRPGSFYRQDMPPIVTALEEAIAECVNRPSRLPGQDIYEAIKGRRKYKEKVSFLNNLADKIIEERIRSAEVGKNGDVLDLMLSQADKDSGQKLDRLNIRQQMLTFLAAGYDTTSGMLMWTVYHLLKNPDVLAKCYAEVDEVFGDDLSVLPNRDADPQTAIPAAVHEGGAAAVAGRCRIPGAPAGRRGARRQVPDQEGAGDPDPDPPAASRSVESSPIPRSSTPTGSPRNSRHRARHGR